MQPKPQRFLQLLMIAVSHLLIRHRGLDRDHSQLIVPLLQKAIQFMSVQVVPNHLLSAALNGSLKRVEEQMVMALHNYWVLLSTNLHALR